MTDPHSVGSATRTLIQYETKKHSRIWRLSAIEACNQERLAWMQKGNAVGVLMCDTVIELIRDYERWRALRNAKEA